MLTKLAGLMLLWTVAYTLGAADRVGTVRRDIAQLETRVETAEAYRLLVAVRMRGLQSEMEMMPPCR